MDEKREIREAVRARYGGIAEGAGDKAGEAPAAGGCCGPAVESAGAGQASSCCVPSAAPGDAPAALARRIGYGDAELAAVPQGANMGLGCGNPGAIAALQPGETVLDLGSGGGFDCFLASPRVGPQGRVIGVDMTPAMVEKARANAGKGDFGNVEFRLGEIEHLPVADATVDVIISNCVVNLSPDKDQVFREALRVLKPGGRVAISDLVAPAPLPDAVRRDMAQVSACVGGADTVAQQEQRLRDAGFTAISIRPRDAGTGLSGEVVEGTNARQLVVSAVIEARKPEAGA